MRAFASESIESRPMERERRLPVTAGSLLTLLLLLVILFAAPLVLGAARLWWELPLLGLAAGLMLVQAVRLARAHEPLRVDFIDLAVVAFTVYAIARWQTSPAEYYSRLEILNVVAYATVFLSCRYGLVRRSHALLLLGLLVVLGVFELGFGYYLSQHLDWCPFGPDENLQQDYAPRWVGTYGCPNHYGEILVMGMSAALAWAAFSKLSWPLRIFLFWVAALISLGIVFSGSRGTWLGAGAAIFALTLAGMRYGTVRWWVPVLGALVLLGGIGGLIAHSSLGQQRINETEQLAFGQVPGYIRVVLARDALRIAHDHPLFGTGPATFVFIHPRYQDAHFSHRAIMAHDDYLNCLADYGAVGFVIAMIFVAGVTRQLLRRPRAAGRWQDRVILTASLMAWSALLIHSFVDFNLHIPANALMFFALTGMGLRRAPSEVDPSPGGIALPRLPTALAVGALSLAYGAVVVPTALSDIILENVQSQALDTRPSVTIERTRQALRIDPHNVPALIFLGDMYRVETSRQTDMVRRLETGEKAVAAYKQAARENPLEDTITASLAVTYDLMSRYPEAYFCYVEALQHQPYDGQFWYRLGNHFWETGAVEKAEQAYQMGLNCPNGAQVNVKPLQEIRDYLAAQGIPRPPVGTNPLDPSSNLIHATVP